MGTGALPAAVEVPVGAALIAVLAVAAAVGARSRRGGVAPEQLPVIGFCLSHGVLVVTSELGTHVDPLGFRLLYPVLPALALTVALAVRALWRTWRPGTAGEVVGTGGRVVLAAYLLWSAVIAGGWAVLAGDRGIRDNAVALADERWLPAVEALPRRRGAGERQPVPAALADRS